MKIFDMNYFILLINFLNFLMVIILIIPSNFYNFHPLTLSMLLVIYTIILTFKMNLMTSSYWYSYILFLVMIGGLMILFMYFTSLINNQMFYLNMNYYFYLNSKFYMVLIFMYLMICMGGLNYLVYSNFIELNDFQKYFFYKDLDLIKNLMMDYIMDMNLYSIIYLFFMMVCSVVICIKTNIPLRQNLKFN